MSDQMLLHILERAQRSQQPGESVMSAVNRERWARELENVVRDLEAQGKVTITGVDPDGGLRWSLT